MPSLTNLDTTRDIYCFIRRYFEERSIPPTHREIAEGCFISSGTINRHLDRLVIFGYIERLEATTRGIRLTDKRPDDCSEIGQ